MLKINNTNFEIINISESGLAFKASTSDDLRLDAQLPVQIFLNHDTPIFEGMGTVVARRESENGRVYGLRFSSQMLGEAFLNALETTLVIRDEINAQLEQHEKLPEEFLTFLHEIKTYLSILKTRIDTLEDSISFLSFDSQMSHQKAIELILGPDVINRLRKFSVRLFEMTAKFADSRTLRLAKKVFRAELFEYYRDASFLRRAWEKPLGYAGDYEMMNQIYRNQLEGKTLFGRLMHKWGINEASSKSVRYRTQYIMNKFKELSAGKKSFVIGCLASGPAREVIEFLKSVTPEESRRYEVVLMDQDGDSLLNAKRGVNLVIAQRGLECRVRFLSISVKNILEGGEVVNRLGDIKFDFIYTMGLYDYLKEPVAKILSETLVSWVKPGGTFIVGNFHVSNTTHSISEFVADWSLILRTEQEMRDLIPDSPGIKKDLHVDHEGIDLFLEVTKK